MNSRLANLALLCLLMITGCGARLSEQSVHEFVDAADEAFLRGRARDVCDMRADQFRLEALEFKLTDARQIVAGLGEAEAIAARRQEAGELQQGEKVVLDHREFCRMAYEARDFYKRASMVRGPLSITMDADQGRATVRAHYTIREPVYGYDYSPLGRQDQVEVQTSTRQSETDDVSVVIVEDGELKFASTASVSKSFHIAKQRDRRL